MITFRELLKVLDPEINLRITGMAIDQETGKITQPDAWFTVYFNEKAKNIASELNDRMWFPDEPVWSISKVGDAIEIVIVSNREE